MRRKAKITGRRLADENNAVVTVVGGDSLYRRTPCEECPWRKDRVGTFPAEAFRISAHTAYDRAMETFACHMSGSDKPACCAGFLLRNSDHNIAVRIRQSDGRLDLKQVHDGGVELHESYRAMAVANGVAPDDPVLFLCRENGYGD